MKIAILIDFLIQYGLPVLVAFFAWLQRKLEKPVVEHEAVQNFASFLGSKATSQEGSQSIQAKLRQFLLENPQYQPRKAK